MVFTTNFDDLINEACFLYSEGLRPVVAAHDSAVTSIRLTQERPKIIKLHGDFLYDNIKNTVRELQSLEANTQKKFMQFAQEYGLVVIGYGGRDRSVIDTLEVLLRSEEYFLPGVYWCIRKDVAPGKRLRSILRRDRVYTVEIDGFDEFMAALHAAGGLKLPEAIIRPFHVARERAKLFVNVKPELSSHPVISSHISEVFEEINRFSELEEAADLVPKVLMAANRRSRGDWDGAISLLQQELVDNPKDSLIAYELGELLALAERKEELRDLARKALFDSANHTFFLLLAEDNEGVLEVSEVALSQERFESDISSTALITKINRAIALKRLGRSIELEVELSTFPEESHPARKGMWQITTGLAALANDKEKMLEYMERALRARQITVQQARMYPVFENYWSDEEFSKLLRDWDQGIKPTNP